MDVASACAFEARHPEKVRDVSGSSGALTVRLDADDGCYYLKSGEAGSLRREYEALRFFHPLGLAPEALGYESGERDCLLMRPLPGSPAVSSQLMSHPDRLARALGRALRDFHDRGIGDCPFSNSAADMLARVERNHRARELDEVMARAIGETDIDRIYERIRAGARLLEDDVIVHGDFCLPNVFFDGEYRFAGFIDLGMAGRGDRHYDLYWGRWTLRYNLGTDAYGDAFFDAYGAADIDPARIEVAGLISCLDG